MCGIAGLVGRAGSSESGNARVGRMLKSISHRGPDGHGIESFPDQGVYLGHHRLAIIDPEHGKQPMSTPDGLLTIVFNGEIYNYRDLRQQLVAKGHAIQNDSDTEVLLYAYREWGESCVDRLQGMFAFAIWDEKNRRLFCARDRIGIKPFYYAFDGKQFLFASEIKAILADGSVKAAANPDGLQDYLTFQFCLGDKTLFQTIRKLNPGHLLTLTVHDGGLKLAIRQYWDLVYENDASHDEAWFVRKLSELVEQSVASHLRSDVPLGAHLSGGLDSSSVACLAARLLPGERLNTFTGAFTEGPQFDETGYARIVADFAGTNHHEIFIPGTEFAEMLPRLLYYMDEPLAGPGLIPQYYVSKLAARYVKVVLGGQGGDEIFIGYARYLTAYLEKCLAGAIYGPREAGDDGISLEQIVPNLSALRSYRPMLQGLWSDGLFESSDRRYFKLIDRSAGMSRLFSPDLTKGQGYSPFESFQQIFNRERIPSLIDRMCYVDLKCSLPALLHVEDRTSMAASIESRVPLLDHRIVEFMAQIPPAIKFASGRMKHLFRESIRTTVPKAIFDRTDKMGFPTPIGHWCKGVARDFVRDTLLSARARGRGLYNAPEVEQAIDTEQEFGRVVWGLLCLELWHRIFIDGDFQPSLP